MSEIKIRPPKRKKSWVNQINCSTWDSQYATRFTFVDRTYHMCHSPFISFFFFFFFFFFNYQIRFVWRVQMYLTECNCSARMWAWYWDMTNSCYSTCTYTSSRRHAIISPVLLCRTFPFWCPTALIHTNKHMSCDPIMRMNMAAGNKPGARWFDAIHTINANKDSFWIQPCRTREDSCSCFWPKKKKKKKKNIWFFIYNQWDVPRSIDLTTICGTRLLTTIQFGMWLVEIPHNKLELIWADIGFTNPVVTTVAPCDFLSACLDGCNSKKVMVSVQK